MNDIDLGDKKEIEIVNAFLPVKRLNVDRVTETISNLGKEEAGVLVSLMTFGVDNSEPEHVVYEAASCKATPTTMASDITRLYGLTDIGMPIVRQHNDINEVTLYHGLPLFFYFIIGLTFIGWLILSIMFIRSRTHSRKSEVKTDLKTGLPTDARINGKSRGNSFGDKPELIKI